MREAPNNAVKTGRAPHVSIDGFDEGGSVVLVEDDVARLDVGAVLGSDPTRGSRGLLGVRVHVRRPA